MKKDEYGIGIITKLFDTERDASIARALTSYITGVCQNDRISISQNKREICIEDHTEDDKSPMMKE